MKFPYDSQTKIYNWTVNVANADVWLSHTFWSKLCHYFEHKITVLCSLLKTLQYSHALVLQ